MKMQGMNNNFLPIANNPCRRPIKPSDQAVEQPPEPNSTGDIAKDNEGSDSCQQTRLESINKFFIRGNVLPNIKKDTGFKNLYKESSDAIEEDLKGEIYNICKDETGENINMKQLSDILDIYIEFRNRK